MIPEAKKEVIAVLQEAADAIKQKRYFDLHAISDHILHTIIIYQDKDVVEIAIAIYAINKILEKEKYALHPKVKGFVKIMLDLLKETKTSLQKNDIDGFHENLKDISEKIHSFSASIKFYIDDVLHFARIKKGTRLYEHGLSLGKAAELVGVAKWDLMPAIGETAIHEQPITPEQLNRKRAAFVGKIFKKRKK